MGVQQIQSTADWKYFLKFQRDSIKWILPHTSLWLSWSLRACNVGDLGLIPGLGRSPGEEKGYPLQYSALENSMDYIVHGVSKSQTWLSDLQGFPDSSVGKESACNAGDPGLFHGSGRSAGEGIGYLLQYSWASLVAQLVKNLPATGETWIRSLGWENPLEKRRVTHSSILALRIPRTV